MKSIKLLIIIFFIMIIYYYLSIETFTTTGSVPFPVSTDISNAIIQEIDNRYLTNIDPIRKLSYTAGYLQNNGLILQNNAFIKGRLTINSNTTLKNNLTVDGQTIINGNTNINNIFNIKGQGEILSLEGNAKTGAGSQCYIEMYPRTKPERRKAWIGFGSNDSKDLNIQNQDTGSIIIGNKTKNDAIQIDKDTNTNFNGTLTLNNTPMPIINVVYKKGLDGGNDKTFANETVITSCKYTPKVINSLIHITCDGHYEIEGWEDDDYESRIYINGTQIYKQWQHFKSSGENKKGGDTRSTTIFPLSFIYNNPDNKEITIEIKVIRTYKNDNITVFNNGFILLITEYKATELT